MPIPVFATSISGPRRAQDVEHSGTHVRPMTESESRQHRDTLDDMHVSQQRRSMRHVLDNPVCNALNAPHANVAQGHSFTRHRLLDAPFPPALSRKPIMVPA